MEEDVPIESRVYFSRKLLNFVGIVEKIVLPYRLSWVLVGVISVVRKLELYVLVLGCLFTGERRFFDNLT